MQFVSWRHKVTEEVLAELYTTEVNRKLTSPAECLSVLEIGKDVAGTPGDG